MPMFDFKCNECGHIFEELVFQDEDGNFGVKNNGDIVPIICSSCSSDNLTKLLGPPMLDFRGSGFYATDYKKPKPKNGQGDR